MSFELRDKSRYGIFKANSYGGIVNIEISISGFGEEIKIIKDKKEIAYLDTSNGEELDETNEYIYVDGVTVYKPFIRCLKRFK